MATFKEAFREARNAGKKTFTWNGKPYTTELKEEAAARAPKPAAGAYRGQRSEGANEAPKKPVRASEESGMMGRLRQAGLTPSGASEVGAGKSALAALGFLPGVGRSAKAASASGGSVAPALRAEFEAFKRGGTKAMEQERRSAAMAKRAEGPATSLKSTNTTSETGRKFTAAQEREATEAAVRGAAARKKMAETRTARSRALEEAKKEGMMKGEKKKPSPRSRTRDEEDIEFSKGGVAYKRKK